MLSGAAVLAQSPVPAADGNLPVPARRHRIWRILSVTTWLPKELADIACPVWRSRENTIRKIVRDGKFEVVEAGHFTGIQNPDRVAAAIRPFLLKIERSDLYLTSL
jgi:hypothetical protein